MAARRAVSLPSRHIEQARRLESDMDRGRGFAVSLFRIVDQRRTAAGKRRSIT
jgi:hypothetical protein